MNIARQVTRAIAVGDTLGLPVEAWRAEKIAQTHGRITTPLAAVLNAVSKDGLLMQTMAAAHIEAYDKACEDFPGYPHPIGWGWSTGDAIVRLKKGIHWSESGKSENPKMGSGNGVIIKIAPVALHLFAGGEELQENPNDDNTRFIKHFTLMTHYSQMAISASLAYVAALLYCLNNTPQSFSENNFIQTLLRYSTLGERIIDKTTGEKDSLTERLSLLYGHKRYNRAMIARKFTKNGRPSYLYNSLPLTLMLFLKNPFSIETLFDVVNAGGDTDSNGSMAAALLACLNKNPDMFSDLYAKVLDKETIETAIDKYERSTSGIFPPWHLFKNSFLLDRQTIRQFLIYHRAAGFEGKLVFNKNNRKLILAPGEDNHQHIQLAGGTDIGFKRDDIVAAFISFKQEGNRIFFELDDKSDEFPLPSMADFLQIARQLSSLLEEFGYSCTINEYPDENRVAVVG